jgi:class 3 adenylate cyclase
VTPSQCADQQSAKASPPAISRYARLVDRSGLTGERHSRHAPTVAQRRLPTGTVTLVFTDIEGSTRLLRELGDSYGEVLGEHRRVVREAFQRCGGVEVGTEGDAFFYAFSKATDAVAAAREGQAALAAGEVRVRIGIHTGEPLLSDDDYIEVFSATLCDHLVLE